MPRSTRPIAQRFTGNALRHHGVRATVGLAISGVLLWLMLRSIDSDELLRTLGSASLNWVAMALAIYWVELALRAQRWRTILQPVHEFSFAPVASSLLVGYSANNVLPARLGELFRADFIGRRYGISRLSAIGTIFIERLLDMAVVVACAAAGVLWTMNQQASPSSPDVRRMLIAGLLAGSLLVGLASAFAVVMTAYSPRWLARRFPRLRVAIDAVKVGLLSLRQPRRILALVALSAAAWSCNALATWAMLNAVGISPPPATLVLLVGMSGLAAAIPSAPANLGTLQFAFITVLATVGHSAAVSFAAAARWSRYSSSAASRSSAPCCTGPGRCDPRAGARMGRASGDAFALRTSRFVSFDGAVSLSSLHQRPDRYRHLEADLGGGKRIARGAGLSYSAASFGEGVVVQEMSSFNRVLAFDRDQRTVRVEAGLTVGDLLVWAGRNGLSFPVLPGYPLITVGGCIAADVHGKNPLRDGTFSDWVGSMTVFHPAQGFRSIDRASDPELFAATCGGFGLTGLIVDATLRLLPLPASNVSVRQSRWDRCWSPSRRCAAIRRSISGYSWHDGAARGPRFGRGIMFFGTWTDEPCAGAGRSYRPMTSALRARFPLSLWNRATVAMANGAFRRLKIHRGTETKSSFDAAFPFAAQTLYHRFFGRPGLAEVQVLVPDASLERFARIAAMALPHYESFRRRLAECDPEHLYRSELSRRLEL
ncbi:MAG: flippase-like domain-containing protein [Betaproteobacteria bacterium]|nr:flippase-like domain-containing protein [Betaproteobacteria bacterium]